MSCVLHWGLHCDDVGSSCPSIPSIGCLNRQPVAGDWWIWASHVFAWRLLWCGMRIVLIWALSGHVLVCLAVLTLFSSLFYRGMVMGRVHRSHCHIISYRAFIFYPSVHTCLLVDFGMVRLRWLVDWFTGWPFHWYCCIFKDLCFRDNAPIIFFVGMAWAIR